VGVTIESYGLSTHISNFNDIGQCWFFAVLWWPFWKWRPVEIASQFDMWVDNDVPNWFPTLNNFYWSPFSKWPPQYRKKSTLSDIITIWYVGRWPFWKWWPVEIFQCQESIRDIIIYPHIKLWWYRTMLIFCGIVVAILKIATNRNCWFMTLNNFYRSPFSKWPPQYRKNSTLSDIITIWYVGR
jgi:hypothetical protein